MRDLRPRTYHFAFERSELALLLAGFAIILVLAFLLGTVVGKRSSSHVLVAETETPQMSPVSPPQEPEEAVVAKPPPEIEQPQEGKEQLQVKEEELTFFSTLPDSGAEAPAPPEQPATPSPAGEGASADEPEESPPQQPQAPPDEPAKLAAVEPAPQQGSYLIQVGSFRDRVPALALAQALRAKGYPAVVRETELAGKGVWYRVRVEGYAEKAAAAHVARMLKEREKLPVLVLRGGE